MLNHNKKFDEEFRKIPGLNWFTFVGANYGEPPKILVALQSHHNQGDDSKIELYESNPYNTIECLSYYLSENQEKNETYENLKKLLGFGVDHPNVDSVFNYIAVCNVVQELMPDPDTKPTDEQYRCGIECLKDIVRILNPDIILLCGRKYRNDIESYNLTRVQPTHIPNVKYPLERFCFEGVDVLMTAHPAHRSMHKSDIAKWGQALVDASPAFAAFHDQVVARNADTFSYEQKKEIVSHQLRNLFQTICDENPEFIEAVDDNFGESIYPGDGEYLGFQLKGTDVRLGLNFSEIGYKKLTAGFCFPQGVPDWLRRKAGEDGYMYTNNWYYYYVTSMWNWRDYEFTMILDGSIIEDLRYIVEKVLIAYFVDHLKDRV